MLDKPCREKRQKNVARRTTTKYDGLLNPFALPTKRYSKVKVLSQHGEHGKEKEEMGLPALKVHIGFVGRVYPLAKPATAET